MHCEHSHQQKKFKNLKLAFWLNLVSVVVEAIGGLMIGSSAVVADAIHDLGDAVSLGLTLYLEKVARRSRDENFSYGYARFSLLSALLAGVVILTGSVFVLVQSVWRLLGSAPDPLESSHLGLSMAGLAIFGILINSFVAWRLGDGHSHSEKMLKWHFFEDVAGWVIVLVGGIAIHLTGWSWLDPTLAAALAVFMASRVGREVWRTLRLFLQAFPENFVPKEFLSVVESWPGVRGVHDLHAWSLDGRRHVLSLHLVVESNLSVSEREHLKTRVRSFCRERGDYHVTVELETGDNFCHDDCEGETH